MRKILTLISFIVSAMAQVRAQSVESHNLTTYDTVVVIPTGVYSAPDQWNVRITRPVNMFVPGNADTASRPAIITMPGIGEQGNNNTANLVVYGPHYWLNNGWDGSVVLGNGTHYPILITVSYINGENPTAPSYYSLLALLLNTYHIKRNSVYLGGLSQGTFSAGALIEYEQTAGAETGMSIIKAMALFEGTPDPLPAPFSTWSRGNSAFAVWAQKFGGKLFTLEGNGSDNFRNSWVQADTMNAVVPGSAYFSYEDLGGGAHCCWNSMYDPSATNWTCVGTLGPNNAPSQVGLNTMGDYHAPSSVFQWLLRQGDSSLVGAGAPPHQPPVANAGANQTITLPTSSVTLAGSGTDPDGTITSYAWSQTAGPSSSTISNAGIVNPVISNLVAGVYSFTLKVTDNSAATGTATMTITVNPAPLLTLPAPLTIPGQISASSYSGSIGVETQVTSDIGGGLNVGWIDPGDWMNYNVNVTTAGSYTVNFRIATPNSGAAFQLRTGSGTVLATVNLASTGGYQTWQTVSATVSLAAGTQTLQIISTGTALWNINWIQFILASQPSSGKLIPGKIEASNYDSMSGVATQTTSDIGGGLNVGWIDEGDWMSYNVTVQNAGTYLASFRIATPNNGCSLQVQAAGGAVLATLDFNSTGGYQTYQTINAVVTLPAGNQTLKLVSTSAVDWNINWMEFDLPGNSIPGEIVAADYNTMSGVATQATSDIGGGLNVGWIDDGDWMSYNVNVAAAGTYMASFRIATPNNGCSFQVQSGSGTVLATLDFGSTGGYQTYQTISAEITLPAGSQTLKLVSTSAVDWNISLMAFANTTSTTGSAANTTVLNSTAGQFASPGVTDSTLYSLGLYPNPAKDQALLEINNVYTGKMLVQVYNDAGILIKAYQLEKDQTNIQVQLSTGDLPVGVYFIRVQIGNWSATRKLLKL